MYGTYIESARIVERLITLYEGMPMEEEEKSTAVSALRAARAMILDEEGKAIEREEHEMAGRTCPNEQRELYGMTYEQLAGGV